MATGSRIHFETAPVETPQSLAMSVVDVAPARSASAIPISSDVGTYCSTSRGSTASAFFHAVASTGDTLFRLCRTFSSLARCKARERRPREVVAASFVGDSDVDRSVIMRSGCEDEDSFPGESVASGEAGPVVRSLESLRTLSSVFFDSLSNVTALSYVNDGPLAINQVVDRCYGVGVAQILHVLPLRWARKRPDYGPAI